MSAGWFVLSLSVVCACGRLNFDPLSSTADAHPGPDDAPVDAGFVTPAITSTGTDLSAGVATDSAGNIYVGGSFTSSIDLGGGPLSSTGNYDIFVASYTALGEYRWSRSFGGARDDDALALTVDAADNVYVGGTFGSTMIDFGDGVHTVSGEQDAFAASLTSAGILRWSRTFGGAATGSPFGSDQVTGMGTGPGAFYVAGKFIGTADFGNGKVMTSNAPGFDAFVAAYDLSGTCQWLWQLGNTNFNHAGAVRGTTTDVVVGGYYEGNPQFGAAMFPASMAQDPFVAHLSTTGVPDTYVTALASGPNDSASDFDVAADGSQVFVGVFAGQMAIGGQMIVASASDGFIAALTPSGALAFFNDFGAGGNDTLRTAKFRADGTILTAGQFQNTIMVGGMSYTANGCNDGIVIDWNPDGSVAWVKVVSGPGNDRINHLVDMGSRILVVGVRDTGPCDGSADRFFVEQIQG